LVTVTEDSIYLPFEVWLMSLKPKVCALLCILLLSAFGFGAAGNDLRLLEAIKKRDRAAVRSVMAQHADVNAASADGTTALAWAAIRDDLETVDLLIRAGANVNAATDYGVTPLSLACTNGNVPLVEKLLSAGANPNAAEWTGETPLMICARTGAVQAVKSLISRGANPNVRENLQGQTALMRATAMKQPDVVRALIQAGADVHARSNGGFTALLFASQQGDIDSARLLLEAGAHVNEATPLTGSALVLAAASGHEKFSLFLLEHGADAKTGDADGVTALHYAIPRGLAGIDNISVIFRPLESIPLDMPELVKALLSHGADPNARIVKAFPGNARSPYDPSPVLAGATPFLLAAAAADVKIMRVLLDKGADPQLMTNDGSTPLMVAAGVGRVDDRPANDEANALEAVKLAASLGNDVNAANERGRTALHGAAGGGSNAIVQFLAGHGANLNARDRRGNTPVEIALGMGTFVGGLPAGRVYKSTADLFLKLGAQPPQTRAASQ
jgi:uncharacterized protein